VRPVRLDTLRVVAPGLEGSEWALDRLDEGESHRWMTFVDGPVTELVVEGQLWRRPLRQTVTVDRRASVLTAAYVISEGHSRMLQPAELQRLATQARMVSPVTSLLAVEPGAAPSRAGFDHVIGFGGRSFGCGGCTGTSIGSSMAIRTPPLDLRALLERDVARCEATHAPPSGWSVPLTLEATGVEVVDVQTETSPDASDALLATAECLTEAVWKTHLPATGAAWHHSMRALLP
ncbi:MAG: hypothetical protein QF464_18125, partial [Myxococcota bacterium]|nr:hypothetical protein [Myxococcota bacterium]